MKMSTLFWLGILFVIEIKGAHATWAPGKEPDHLQEGDPRITQIVEHPGGVKKFWYEYWIQKKDGTTAKKTGVQVFDGDGKLTDDIRDFNTDNTVTKIDHTTGEEVRVSTIVPSLRKLFQPSPKEVEEMRLFRRFTKYSIIDGYEAFKKNVKINAKDPCPAEMKEELRKACLTFGANPNSFELSREPDPSISPKEKCLPGVAAFPDDPFYKAACIGTWLGLQGNSCGTSGLEGSSGRLAFLVCSATIAAREEHECKEVLPAAEKSMDGSLHIRPTQQEEAKQAIVMTASEGRHLFLGVCGGLKKIYAEAKLVHCSKDPAVATNHMKDMHRTAGKIQQELSGKENKKNSGNSSSVRSRSAGALLANIPEEEQSFFMNEQAAQHRLKLAGNTPGSFLIRRSRDKSMHLIYVDSLGNYVPVKLSNTPETWIESLEKLDVWKDGTLKTLVPNRK